ncbi:unnamed protein product [Lupinus luteus]|uniref:Uncharacterized protein n=1 Tax=Lupinus luteus TaxID=3873 RepID=A0AAV1XXD3_LUPLU
MDRRYAFDVYHCHVGFVLGSRLNQKDIILAREESVAEEKESTSIALSQAENASHSDINDPEDPTKSPPNSPNYSTRRVCCFILQSWVSEIYEQMCSSLSSCRYIFH